MHLSVDVEGWGEVPPEEAQAAWLEEGTRSTANERTNESPDELIPRQGSTGDQQ